MSKTIVIIQGSSQYNVLNLFNEQFSNSFIKLGYNVEIIDLTKENWTQELNQVIQTQKITFFFSLNAVATHLASDGESLFDRLGIPLVVYLVDHPFHHIDRLMQGPKNMVVAAISRDHLDFIRNILDLKTPLIFLPHGAVSLGKETEIKTVAEREIDILFTGSYFDVNEIHRQLSSLPNSLKTLTNKIIDHALFETNKPLVSLIEEVFEDQEIDRIYLLHRQYWNVVVFIDLFIRGYRRNKVIDSLQKCGVNVEVYGNGWESLSVSSSSIKFNRSIPFTEVYEKMKNSKIVLSVLPNFASGLHERPLTAMYTGAVNLADSNPYINTVFKDKEHILYYNNSYDLVDVNLDGVLGNLDSLQRISDQAYNLVRQLHMWEHRAQSLLDQLDRHFYFVM